MSSKLIGVLSGGAAFRHAAAVPVVPPRSAVLGSLVGVAVGAVEIRQRYRAIPRGVPRLGIGYVVLNAAVSYGAFGVLYYWINAPPSDASRQSATLHLMGLAAGAALIRARLATIRLPSKRAT